MLEKGLNIIRKIVGGHPENWFRGGMELIANESANALIRQGLSSNNPFMVARLGSVEIKPLLFHKILSTRSFIDKCYLYVKGDCDYVLNADKYQEYMTDIMCTNAGFFPHESSSLLDFADLMSRDVSEIDLCGCWLNEKLLQETFSNGCHFCQLGALEPYDYIEPWTMSLKGKKVLVIHPFAKSIESQYRSRESLWENKNVLPDFELKTIQAVQSIAGSATCFGDWFEALNYMKEKMDGMEYDVALIGCGAYGLPLAAHAKRQGKKAVHLGGPLQILFGIKGKRWDNIPSVSRFYNENWIRPATEETPVGKTEVEGGCYW